MTDILLVGTFHFRESNINFESDEINSQLDALAKNIARFSPDAVAVELEKSEYSTPISIVDGEWKNKLTNEAFALGGRIASFSNLKSIHPIDKIFPLNDAIVSEENMKLIKPRLDYLQKADFSNVISQRISILNSIEYATCDANMYLDINANNADGSYSMSRYLADWFFRNLCIFSNIQALSHEYNRIVVLYGAGHISILKDFINTCDSMKLMDTNLYL